MFEEDLYIFSIQIPSPSIRKRVDRNKAVEIAERVLKSLPEEESIGTLLAALYIASLHLISVGLSTMPETMKQMLKLMEKEMPGG
ncbi:hypothetical protein [Candidatus Methanodesulfokora washburnensis]|uniref:Uncharacterized protein n=1 Tax=Candidatus Methanodesulfokora washburnensis TaxID=2478471 RepID=A0A429GMY9_9CREN|nr:hypothetical protein [Candidatus Methanodesulfokores washburnensis]RSN75255.1 hypothetical protein D6D85_06385 [Candidatus Methanodesulfokores washburnensis]